MDLKISDPIQSNSLGAPASRTEGVGAPPALGGKQRLQSVGSVGADSIEISSLTGRIAEGLSTDSAQRSGRVRQLAALYSAGRLAAPAGDVSRALISHALGGRKSEGV